MSTYVGRLLLRQLVRTMHIQQFSCLGTRKAHRRDKLILVCRYQPYAIRLAAARRVGHLGIK